MKKHEEFQRVFQEGVAVVHRLAVLHIKANGGSLSRVGFSVSKKVIGKAVERNRIRRRMKEALRLLSADVPDGMDMVFVARKAQSTASWDEVYHAMEYLLSRAGRKQP